MATDVVYNFLKEHNRPFSANDVLNSIDKDHGKAAVQNALDKLTSKGKILEKVYGKQKIYCVIQEEQLNADDMCTALRKMDNEITELNSNLTSVKEQLHSNSNELKSLQNKMSIEEAHIERDKLSNEVSMLKNKLGALKGNCEPVKEEDKVKIKGEHEKCVKEYRKRKRICGDITNSILEGYPKTKKHLFEDIGIETDEDVEFTLVV